MSDAPIALTGATGFIGRAVVEHLVAGGRPVVALVRPTTDTSILPDSELVATVLYEQLDDVDVAAQLREHRPAAFVHLGWAGVGSVARRQVDQVGVNVPATVASVELASAAGCTRWVGLGSQAEYGPSFDVLTEHSPLHPNSSYGRAKVQAWTAAQDAARMLGLSHAWARVFSVYGPGDHATAVIPYVIDSLLQNRAPKVGAGSHEWDLLFVDDAAAALIALADSTSEGAFNLAHGGARPLRDAFEIIDRAIGAGVHPTYAAEPVAPAVPLRGDATKLQEATGWAPRTSLTAGLTATIDAVAHELATPAGGTA